jgi:hypothetical protein
MGRWFNLADTIPPRASKHAKCVRSDPQLVRSRIGSNSNQQIIGPPFRGAAGRGVAWWIDLNSGSGHVMSPP